MRMACHDNIVVLLSFAGPVTLSLGEDFVVMTLGKIFQIVPGV